MGATGIGATGPTGATGIGATGPTGAGTTGPTGPGGYLDYAMFYALVPQTSPYPTFGYGDPLAFDYVGLAMAGTGITLNSGGSPAGTSYNLAVAGIYEVYWEADITCAGLGVQLQVALNGIPVAYSGHSYTTVSVSNSPIQISGDVLIQTTVADTTLTILNPAGNSTAIAYTPPTATGLTNTIAEILLIKRIA
jgi:hypothetical protein